MLPGQQGFDGRANGSPPSSRPSEARAGIVKSEAFNVLRSRIRLRLSAMTKRGASGVPKITIRCQISEACLAAELRGSRNAADPAHRSQVLLGGKPCLVGHFPRPRDPIAKVNKGKTAGLCEGDLLHDDVIPEAPLGKIGLVEAIDEGNPIAEAVTQHGGHEWIVLCAYSPGPIDPILCQKGL